MQKLILFIFLLFFSISLLAEDLILKPNCFVKLKITDYSGYDYALNRSDYFRNEYYLICENKNKENIALRLRESQKELPRYAHVPSINIIIDKTVYVYIYRGSTKLYELRNYDKDAISLIFNTWYNVKLKTKKILDDNIIEMSDQMSKKDFIFLRENFNISKIIDCFAKDNFIFTLIAPESHERIDKKEFSINLS